MKRSPEAGPGDMAAVFDRYAPEYDSKFNRNPIAQYQRRSVQKALLPYCSKNVCLLDAGCGPGSDFEFFAQQQLDVTAFDLSPEMIAIARHRAKEVGLDARCSVASLADFQSSKKFDIVLLNFGVLNALANPAQHLTRLDRMLKPGGMLVVVVMPAFHFSTAVEQVFRLQWRGLFNRLIRRTALLPDGCKFHYYHAGILPESYSLIKRLPLGALLPNPDQYARHPSLVRFANLTMPIDEKASRFLPAFCGGDHVCYILLKPDR